MVGSGGTAGRCGRVWRAVFDSSLGQIESAEVVSPILRYGDIETLQEIVRALRRARAKVSSSCGIHIHVGAEGLQAKHLANLAKTVHKRERLIEAALQINLGRLRTYTKPVNARFVEEVARLGAATDESLKRAWYGGEPRTGSKYHETRYHGLNLHSVWYRGTIEFRWFESTLHAGKIRAYIQFCLALCTKASNSNRADHSRREYRPESAKYDFRCFLLRLGMIGDEFKTARLHLLANLAGDAAFREPNQRRRDA
jgi:hypothetical protein